MTGLDPEASPSHHPLGRRDWSDVYLSRELFCAARIRCVGGPCCGCFGERVRSPAIVDGSQLPPTTALLSCQDYGSINTEYNHRQIREWEGPKQGTNHRRFDERMLG